MSDLTSGVILRSPFPVLCELLGRTVLPDSSMVIVSVTALLLALFDGINQETVFTSIDFTNHTYGQQPEFETTYFQEYLSKAKEYGLAVYLLEYKADCALSKRIDAYCEENGFLWYNADSLELC